MNRVEQARAMALEAHGDQRYGQEPYSVHLDAVAALCEGYQDNVKIVAYLHDTLEDTALKAETIEAAFGPTIRECVEALTDPPGANRAQRKAWAYATLGAIDANTALSWALVVKAADRLANVQASVAGKNKGLLTMYRKEHATFVNAVRRPYVNEPLVDQATKLLGLT